MSITGHFWIANEKGEVIYDPEFPEYAAIRKIRGLKNKKIYVPADPEEQKEMIQKWVLPTLTNPTARKMAKEMKKNGDIVSVYQACQANVAFYKMINGSKGKIVYGSMGWETKDGDAWLEFEHTRMSKTMKRKIIAGLAAAAAATAAVAINIYA